ncbi:hypothetical protein VTJ49DRAFT_7647 [Mycothermus thermophilus]|uniref:F-box domain-containing protein n=1 Tax=Humicola insolens TaxID=85995 RepID=A0ABR3VGF5_HUMIN
MPLPYEVVLLAAEHLDTVSIRSLARTCRIVHQLVQDYEHSIAKGMISRALPEPINLVSPISILSTTPIAISSMTRDSAWENLWNFRSAILSGPTFRLVAELEARGRRIDAFLAPRTPDSPRGVGILRDCLDKLDQFRGLREHETAGLIQGLKEACRLVDHLADLGALVHANPTTKSSTIPGADGSLRTLHPKVALAPEIHNARRRFLIEGGLTPLQLAFLSLLADLYSRVPLPMEHPTFQDTPEELSKRRESFLRHGTALLYAQAHIPEFDLPATMTPVARMKAHTAYRQLQAYYRKEDGWVFWELRNPSPDNLQQTLLDAVKGSEEGEDKPEETDDEREEEDVWFDAGEDWSEVGEDGQGEEQGKLKEQKSVRDAMILEWIARV